MNGWAILWTWTLAIGLAIFTLVVLTVTIGGLRDIRDMLRSLRQGHSEDQSGSNDRETKEN